MGRRNHNTCSKYSGKPPYAQHRCYIIERKRGRRTLDTSVLVISAAFPACYVLHTAINLARPAMPIKTVIFFLYLSYAN